MLSSYKISIEGYKSIGEKCTIDVKGLTVLAGANSSGKSSFFQPLLLIKQTLESSFDAGVFKLDGPNVNFSDSSEILSRVSSKNKSRLFSIGMFQTINNVNRELHVDYEINKDSGVRIKKIFGQDDNFPGGINITNELLGPEIREERNKYGTDVVFDDFTYIVQRDRCFLEIISKSLSHNLSFGLSNPALFQLGYFAVNIIHVSGLRGNPQRIYNVSASDVRSFSGVFDKYIASIIHKWQTSDSEKFVILIKYLSLLELTAGIQVDKLNDSQLIIKVSRYKTKEDSKTNMEKSDLVNIADVGFGVSQILPVLVALLVASGEQVVYIEQPELHLHPNAQAKLANIVANVIKDKNIKIILETHSSIFLRSLQTCVVKNELPSELVSLNWFTQNKKTGQTNISSASLDELGAFGDWPEDFDSTILSVERNYLDAVVGKMSNEKI